MVGLLRDESVDLIHLDPPFNLKASYNVLFKAPTGEHSQAQIEAFEDTVRLAMPETGAFCARRCEGPYRLIQNRSRTSAVAPTAEKSKDQLLRDFWGLAIFEFFNTICHKQTSSN